MQNRFGEIDGFALKVWGHSHTPTIGIGIYGLPLGFKIDEEELKKDLKRRKAGAFGTTSRIEEDIPSKIEYGSNGVYVEFNNSNIKDEDYNQFIDHPRPSHADYVQWNRYHDQSLLLGGGIASGRMTLLLVTAGSICKQIIKKRYPQLKIESKITQIKDNTDNTKFKEIIQKAIELQTSVGVKINCQVKGDIPTFIGEPFFNSFESILSHLIFSIPGVKGIEFGDGFECYTKYGHERNDCFGNHLGITYTNNEGGINGGLTNGNIISFNVAVKPTPSIGREQNTFNFKTGQIEPLKIGGRHDVCFGLRVPVVIESVTAITLLYLVLCKEDLVY